MFFQTMAQIGRASLYIKELVEKLNDEQSSK
jgi:hypothetical protein